MVAVRGGGHHGGMEKLVSRPRWGALAVLAHLDS
jgi:hypothetical protein